MPAHAVAEYPGKLNPTEATSIWMQYMTAYGALLELGELKKGEFVLITAASSSAGLAAIETVKAEQAIAIARQGSVTRETNCSPQGPIM